MKQQTRPKTSITSTSLITINERDDEKRNKYGKTEQRNKIYIARMKMEAVHDTAGSGFIVNGVRVCTTRWLDLYKTNRNFVYKSVHTPCSCCLCQSVRYNCR